VANRARPARDGIYPEGVIRFTYDGEPMDGYSELAGGRASVNGAVTLRSANTRRRSITVKVTSGGPLDIGPSGTTAGTVLTIANGAALTLSFAADARIDVASSGVTSVEFIEELVKS